MVTITVKYKAGDMDTFINILGSSVADGVLAIQESNGTWTYIPLTSITWWQKEDEDEKV